MPSINVPASGPLILALDTSSPLGSVALSRGEAVLKSLAFAAEPSHSQKLLPAIDALFAESGVSVSAVDLFAVVVGPGSFTGLRVALACVRGLAGKRPCFGGLTTDVAAWAARGRGRRILAITDLFHGEVFGSVHDSEGTLVSERESGDVGPVLEALKAHLEGTVVAVGTAAMKHRDTISPIIPSTEFLDLPEGLAPHLASLAAVRSAGSTVRAGDLMPFYLRDPLTRGLLNTRPKAR